MLMDIKKGGFMSYDITFQYTSYDDSENLGTATFYYDGILLYTSVDTVFVEAQKLSNAFSRVAKSAGSERAYKIIRMIEGDR